MDAVSRHAKQWVVKDAALTAGLIMVAMVGVFIVATVLFAGLVWLAGVTEWYA